MTEMPVRDIEMDPAIQIRDSNHGETIERYMDSFERLPPIDVFATPEGKYVADGFQRLAAAIRLGRQTIEVTLHEGTYQEAAEFAAVANTRSGDPLTRKERSRGIRRLRGLHADWSTNQIAEAMSVGQTTVRDVLNVDKMRTNLIHSARAMELPDAHIREVARAPEPAQQQIAEAASDRGWTASETASAVRNLQDEALPSAHKRALLDGEADPVVAGPNGEYAMPVETISRRVRQQKENSAQLAYAEAVRGLARLELFRPDAITEVEPRRLQQLVDELPRHIAFMEDVLASARRKSQRLEAV